MRLIIFHCRLLYPLLWTLLRVIPCDLCNTATQYFCNSCQNNFCLDCISKHISKFQSLSHRIVTFSERKIQLVLPACLEHHRKRCESYCKKCDVPVCWKCTSKGSHKWHVVENLTEKIELRKRVFEIKHKNLKQNLLLDTKVLKLMPQKPHFLWKRIWWKGKGKGVF